MIPVFPNDRPRMLLADGHGFYQTRDTLSEFPVCALPGLLGEIAQDLCAARRQQ